MKITSIGADISSNDISCSNSLIKNIEADIFKLEKLGAVKAALTNVTGDDVVTSAFVEDDLLETINAGIVDILKNNAENLGDLKGISKDPNTAGEGISYAEANIREDRYPDAVILGFDTYGGESFVGKAANSAIKAAMNMDDVTDKYINDVKKNSENIIPKHLEPMKKIYNSYSQIAKSIDLMDEETLVDICLDIVGSKIEEIGETYTDEYLEKKVRAVQLAEGLDEDDTNFLGTLKMIKALGIGVATVKKDFLKIIDDMRSDIYFNLFEDKQLYNSIKDEIIEECAYKRG